MRGEYGRAKLRRTGPSLVLPDDAPDVHDVWMSHFDAITEVPPGFTATASTDDAPVAVLESDERRIYGVQFHPEVVHSPYGMGVLRRFLHERAGCPPTWTMSSVIDEQVARIRAEVGDGRVLCALSGGVDSSVAAALVHRAVGHQLTCIYVDTGLMRKGESEQVTETFRRTHGHRADPRRRRRPLPRPPRRRRRARRPSARRSATSSSASSRSTPGGSSKPSSSSRARCTPTSSSPEAPTARRL